MTSMQHEDYLALRHWFGAAIKDRGIDHRSEALSYDANTAYDYAYYRLQVEARDVWLQRYGYAPTDEMLSRAFFDAEIERYRRARDWRDPFAWLKRRLAEVSAKSM